MENTLFTQLNNRLRPLYRWLAVGLAFTLLAITLAQSATAVSPPNIFSYQGRILNSNGVPVSAATTDMQFRLYNSLSGGTCLWSNDDSSCTSTADIAVTLTDGLFSENLGDTGAGYAAINDSIFADNAAVYLEVDIEGETLSPRKRIVAAPYALNAETLDGLDSTDFLADSGDTATGSYDFTGAEILGASPLAFEGNTNDNVYTTLAFTDPTGANTITFPDSSGTVALTSGLSGFLTAANNLSDVASTDVARTNLGLGNVENTALSTWAGSTNITTLGTITTGTWNAATIDISDNTNLTGDSEIVLTDDTLSIAASIARDSELHNAVTVTATYDYITLTGQQLNINQIDLSTDVTGTLSAGNIADAYLLNNGDSGTGDYDFTGAEFLGASPLVFEGNSNDGNTTTFTFTDPSGANIITFQDGTGTVAFTSDIPGAQDLDSVYDTDADQTLDIDHFNGLTFDLVATGDFILADNGTPFATFDDSGNTTFANDFTVDTDTFFVDASTDRIGSGTTSPGITFDIRRDEAAYLGLTTYDTTDNSIFLGRRARGSQATPAAVATDDILLSLNGRGYTGTGFSNINAAIDFVANQIYDASNGGSRIEFFTVDDGTTTLDQRMVIDDAGYVGIGTTTPNNYLQVVDLVNFDNTNAGTFLGYQSGNLSLTGDNNTNVGYQSGTSLTTGYNNTALGYRTLNITTTASENVALGAYALRANTAWQNVAVGNSVLETNTGASNTGVGYASLSANSSGQRNSAFGYNAGATNTTGSYNTFIGAYADASSNNFDRAVAIGYNALVGASNAFVLGGTGTDAVNVGISTSTPDRRLEILDTTNPQLRLTHTDSSVYTDMQTTASGDLVIIPTGAKAWLTGDFLPATDDTYDLGSSNYRWQDLYLGPDSLHLGTDGNEAVIGYNTASNDLRFKADGTNTHLVIQSSGDVGIGTLAPAAYLDVAASQDNEFIRLSDKTNTDSTGIYTGTGTPNGALSAEAGSIFLDQTGAIYVNTDGATAWTDLTTAGGADTFESVYSNDGDKTLTASGGAGFTIDLTSSGGFVIEDSGTPFVSFDVTGVTSFTNTGNVITMGDGTASDVSITFDEDTNDGIINWDNSNDEFDFNSNINVNGGAQFAGGVSINGTSTSIGDATTDDLTVNAILQGNIPLVFEGATANPYEIFFDMPDPATSDITIAFQDLSGTVALLSDVTGAGNTLDAAYDQGGAGAGRIITVDSGAVNLSGTGSLLSLGDGTASDFTITFDEDGTDGTLTWDSTNDWFEFNQALQVASGASFQGGVTINGSTIQLGDATTDEILTTAYFGSDLIPNTDDFYDLGSSAYRWQDLYLGPTSLHIGQNGNEGILSYSTTDLAFNFNQDIALASGKQLLSSGRIEAAPHAANQGFQLPTFSGNPGSVAGTSTGDIVFDVASSDLYVFDGSSFLQMNGGGSVSLDDAYNNGSSITVDSGAVSLAGTGNVLSLGNNSAADITLTFNEEATDGTITWDNTNNEFDFSHNLDIAGGASFAGGVNIDGSSITLGDATTDTTTIYGEFILGNHNGTNPTGSAGMMYYDVDEAKFKCYENGSWADCIASPAGGNTLDQAYDQGGAGVGRTITVDSGAVSLSGTGSLLQLGNGTSSTYTITFDEDGSDGTISYDAPNDEFDFSHNLNVAGGAQFSGGVSINGTSTNIGDATTDDLTVNAILQGDTPLIFEGSTANPYEIIFDMPDPTTTDRTITFQDASGTVALTSDLSGFASSLDEAYDGGSSITVDSGAVTLNGTGNLLTLGDGTATDFSITFDEDTNDGTITWDASADEFDFNSNINVNGGASFTGGVNIDGSSITLGNATTDTITANAYFGSDLIPNTDDFYDLGSSNYRWQDLYLGPQSLHIGLVGDDAVIAYSTTDSRLEFKPDGSTARFTVADAGDLAFDTDTLFVDASADSVGIGTNGPDSSAKLDVYNQDTSTSANTRYASYHETVQSGNLASGTDSSYGVYGTASHTGSPTGGTVYLYGGRFAGVGNSATGDLDYTYGVYGEASGGNAGNIGVYGIASSGELNGPNTGGYFYVDGTLPSGSTSGDSIGVRSRNLAIYTGTSTTPNKYAARFYSSGEWSGGESYGIQVQNNSANNNNAATGKWGGYISNSNTSLANTSYGLEVENLTTNSSDAATKYGVYISSTGTFDGSGNTTNNYGLYVAEPTGADNNYASVFAGGNVGLGVSDPDEQLELTGRIHMGQAAAPGVTTDKLYNVGGTLYWNGTDLTATGSPGGADTYVQYNNAGSFGGEADFTWDDSTNTLSLATGDAEFRIMESSGATYYGTLDVTNLSADRTYTFPNTTGTVALTSQIPTVYWQQGSFAVYEDDNDVVVGTSGDETIANAGFSLTGDDFFVTGDAGIEGNVYTDGSFIAGASLTLSDTGITDSNSDMNFSSSTDGFNFTLGGGAGDDFIVDSGTFAVESDTNQVGIGTTDPSYELDVVGDINVRSGDAVRVGGGHFLGDLGEFTTVAVGYRAGEGVTTGYGNEFVGYRAGLNNTGGLQNAVVGYEAGYNLTNGAYNTLIGNEAGYYSAASYNTYVGRRAGYGVTGSSSASYYNVALGYHAGYGITSGDYNVLLGYEAGENVSSGGGNVMIGYQAGYNETGSNKLYIDNSSTSSPLIYGDFSSNRVGINTSSVNEALNIAGDIELSSGTNRSILLPDTSFTLYIGGEDTDTNPYSIANNINTGYFSWRRSSAELMRLTSTGLGIGNSGPSNDLNIGASGDNQNRSIEVIGDYDAYLRLVADTDNVTETHNPWIYMSQDNGAVEAQLGLVGNAGTAPDGTSFTDTRADSLFIGTPDSQYLQFGTNGQTRLNIAENGHIGIDVDDPYLLFEITDSRSIALVEFQNTYDNGASDVLDLQIHVTTPGTGNNFVTFYDTDSAVGNIDGNGSGGTRYNTSGADYAEIFTGTAADFASGDILGMDSTGEITLASSTVPPIGAHSAHSAFLGNAEEEWYDDPNAVPVGLLGQLPVKVNVENGIITAGDFISISSTAGVGMKANLPSNVVGTALEDWSGPGEGTINVYIKPHWNAGGAIANDGTYGTFEDNFAFTSTGTADAVTEGYDSHGLTFRGSGYDGAAMEAKDVEMTIVADVTDYNDYSLSVENTAGTQVALVNDEGDLAISGKLYPSAQGALQTDKYVYYGGVGDNYMRTNAAGWGTGSYDFAEMFPSTQTLIAGELVVFDSQNLHVRRATDAYDGKLAGIVSTEPGFLAGANEEGTYPIALAGRVPAKVNLENGAIEVGDPITSSSVAGLGMKATEAGMIVGYALEPYSGAAGQDNEIIVFVNSTYYAGSGTNPDAGTDNIASGTTSSNLTSLNMEGNIYMHGFDIRDVGVINGVGDSWKIEADGTFLTESVIKTVIESYQNEMVETTAVTSTDTVVTLTGNAELSGGQATINFEDIKAEFNDITSTTAPVNVVVTPNGPVSLYVSAKDHNGFTVEQIGGNDSGITFDWMVTAYRKDYEPVADEPVAEDPIVIEPTTDTGSTATNDTATTDTTVADTATTDTTDPIVIDPPADSEPTATTDTTVADTATTDTSV